jgi:hypothetical protein
VPSDQKRPDTVRLLAEDLDAAALDPDIGDDYLFHFDSSALVPPLVETATPIMGDATAQRLLQFVMAVLAVRRCETITYRIQSCLRGWIS